jgi:hypothetical protein
MMVGPFPTSLRFDFDFVLPWPETEVTTVRLPVLLLGGRDRLEHRDRVHGRWPDAGLSIGS